ncbi:hypothetical protein [Burkholderia alba]|uniref:hypothetical protein n=1 Tax=Burkholderia alba TaxID=2683677 RepID=UPI002B062396|nr:hypothetical protein [Burkholderia alba]
MTTRYVLVVVNVGKAIQNNNLADYVYMVDTTGHVGYNGEGGNELLTLCRVRDTIVWSVVSINPGNDVAISGFGGQAIREEMITPTQIAGTGGTSWSSIVSKTGTGVQYTLSLILDDDVAHPKSFDPFITATPIGNITDDE